MTIIRRYVNEFMRSPDVQRPVAALAAATASTGGLRCAEVGDGHFLATFLGKLCKHRYSIDIKDSKADVRMDLTAPDYSLPGVTRGHYHAIVINEVLEHISQPVTALTTLKELLAPGGVLITTTPFLMAYHANPDDYLRYTKSGVRSILSQAGLQVGTVRSYGNFLALLGFNAGFGADEVQPKELDAPDWSERDRPYDLDIASVSFKASASQQPAGRRLTACEDHHSACGGWKGMGLCQGPNGAMMSKSCPKSCGICPQQQQQPAAASESESVLLARLKARLVMIKEDAAVMGGWISPQNGWRTIQYQSTREPGPFGAGRRLVVSDVHPSFEFDIVVPFFLTGVNSIRRMHALNRFVRPRPRRIYLLGATTHTCRYLARGPDPVRNLYCLPAQALSGQTIPEMKRAYANLPASGRAGWFLQQFAKIFVALADIGLSEDFLIMDSDNLLLQPLTVLRNVSVGPGVPLTYSWRPGFFNVDMVPPTERGQHAKPLTDTGHPLYPTTRPAVASAAKARPWTLRYEFWANNNSKMMYGIYGPSTRDLLGFFPAVPAAGGGNMVPHWMVFNKQRVREMLKDAVARVHASRRAASITDALLQRSNRSASRLDASTFSEYTTYASWMMRHHPEQVAYDLSTSLRHRRNPTLRAKYSCFLDDQVLAHLQSSLPDLTYITWEDEKWRQRHGNCPDDNSSLPLLPGLERHVAEERAILFPQTRPSGPPSARQQREAAAWQAARSSLKVVPSDPPRKLVVSLWHVFHAPPWGGGNQFLLALTAALRRAGATVLHNAFSDDVNAVLLNAHTFNSGAFSSSWKALSAAQRERIVVVHRVDGPNVINRHNSSRYQAQDAFVRGHNERYADMTVHQSLFSFNAWSTLSSSDEGFEARYFRRRVLIRNAADSEIFRPKPDAGKCHWPVRVVTSSWSNGWIKGSDSMQFLAKAIAAQHSQRTEASARPSCAAANAPPPKCLADFAFTFIGTNQGLKPSECVTLIAAGDSEHVARALSAQDIYFAPSRKEPASNSLVEAIATRLPVLFRDEGGHPEMVGFGGLPFREDADILPRLAEIAHGYRLFSDVVGQPLHRDIDSIARDYIDAFHGREPGFGARIASQEALLLPPTKVSTYAAPRCRHSDKKVYVQAGNGVWTEAPARGAAPGKVRPSATGAWILPQDYVYNFDRGLTSFLLRMWGGQSVIEIGAGLGCYSAALRAAGTSVSAYDGAQNVHQLTGGLVNSADVTAPTAIREAADWVFCLEVGEHIPRPKTQTFLQNVLDPACSGVVLSWSDSCNGRGVGHVNCMNTTTVEGLLAGYGFALDAPATQQAREACDWAYLRPGLMVFRRRSGQCGGARGYKS